MKSDDLQLLFLRFRDAGDMRALAKLFDAAAPQLMPVAAHLAARRDEADDLLQATFLTAIERAAMYDATRPVLPWLLGILALHARKAREKRGRVVDVERLAAPGQSDPERAAAEDEVRRAVDSACRALPESYATIVRRHLAEGLAPHELALELGLTHGAARVRLHRGLKLLRRALPTAFASGAYAQTSSRGIAAIRELVLRHASELTGSPVPAAGLAPLALIVACLVPVLVAVPVWLAWPKAGAPRVAGNSPSAAPALLSSSAIVSSDDVAVDARVAAEVEASEPATPRASASVRATEAVVRARVLLADGAPAAGARAQLRGWTANDARVREFGVPSDWEDPEPQLADAAGRFEISLDPPRAFQFVLEVEHDAAAEASWRWDGLAPGSVLDLGDVRLELAASIVAHIVDEQGLPLCAHWSVSADAPLPWSVDGREPTFVQASCDEGSNSFVLEHVPARRVELSATSKHGVHLARRALDLVPGETREVELIYDGPDLSRRITVLVTVGSYHALRPDASRVTLSQPGAQPRPAAQVPGRSSYFAFDDLAPGLYDVSIEDPRFQPWTQSGVQVGEVVRARLAGNAAVRLSIIGADGAPYAGRYDLRARLADSGSTFDEFSLVRATEDPPASNVIAGLVPQDCALILTVAGAAPVEIPVLGLAPFETRDVICTLGVDGVGLEGRVLALDGTTPLAGVDVQLTRGERAGHTRGEGSSVWSQGARVPAIESRATTDSEGRFAFAQAEPGRWTVRAMWGRYLVADRTLDVTPEMPPVELAQPEHGFLVGRLLLPEGAPLDDTLLATDFGPNARFWPGYQEGRDRNELFDDATFRIGPLPPGEARVSLMVFTSEPNQGSSAAGWEIGRYAISAGEETHAEIDLRATFPGRLRARIRIDGVAASGGSLALHRADDASEWGSSGHSVEYDGSVLIGSLKPGLVRVGYTSRVGTWTWLLPSTVAIEAGRQAELEIDIYTTERDLRCVDVATGETLANVEVEWQTGLAGHELTSRATTDSAGLVHLRMPEQNLALRCAGDHGPLTTVAWSAGAGPLTIALRRAP